MFPTLLRLKTLSNSFQKNLGQYDRPRILGCEPVDEILVVLSSNQLNIAMFVHQMADVYVSHLVNKSGNTYLIWTENNQYPIYWFTSKYPRSVILAQVLYGQSCLPNIFFHLSPEIPNDNDNYPQKHKFIAWW